MATIESPATQFTNALPLTPLISATELDQSLCEAYLPYMEDTEVGAEAAKCHLRRFFLCILYILTRTRISAMNSLCMSTEMRVCDRTMMAYVAALLVAAYIMGVLSTPLATKGLNSPERRAQCYFGRRNLCLRLVG